MNSKPALAITLVLMILLATSLTLAAPIHPANALALDSTATKPASPSSRQPDLVITDIWSHEGHVCYQIRNIGDTLAPEGHRSRLMIDGVEQATDMIDFDLLPGQRRVRCFAYAWECTAREDTVQVCADARGVVTEEQEENNCREETWSCDPRRPHILSGPVVSDVTQSSAVISWVTDEPADSRVDYGRISGRPGLVATGAGWETQHSLGLTDLEPSSIYGFEVTSSDASGNRSESKAGTFQTLPIPDQQKPVVAIENPGPCQGTARILAPSTDDTGVNKVAFFMNGALLSSDYSPPFELLLDTNNYGNGTQTLMAIAYDLAGNQQSTQTQITITNVLPDLLDPIISITSPVDGETVGNGSVSITAHAYDQNPNFQGSGPVVRVEFYIDGQYRATVSAPGVPFNYTYNWNTMAPNTWGASYELKAVAYDDSGNQAQDSVTVTVPEPQVQEVPPSVKVTRLELTRDGTCYRTGLDVENTGFLPVSQVTVVDRVLGFQPRTSGDTPITASFDRISKECKISMGGALSLDPGESEQLWYRSVPFLTQDSIDYEIGTTTNVSFRGPDNAYYSHDLSIPEPGDLDVEDAFGAANYLIVTHPGRLFGYNAGNEDDVNDLLVSMAKLAADKNGVLGLLDDHNASALLNLIKPGGSWADQLFSDWDLGGGYMLIVGESEIVPARKVSDVRASDNWYADFTGSDCKPELVVGRIIGNDAADLRIPIETSLAAHYNGNRALCISGTGNGETAFQNNAEDVADILEEGMSVDVLHFGDYATETGRQVQFRNRSADVDVIFYRDHGSETSWDGGTIREEDLPTDFGSTSPFVFGCACLTGHFDGETSLAESFLQHGAGVYIGSTEISMRYTNNYAAKEYFEYWIANQVPSGTALKHAKRHMMDVNDASNLKKEWVLEYNLYGDPKYAAGGGAAAATADATAATASPPGEPVSPLEIYVPDYVVTTHDGLDFVTIPGGSQILNPDQPLVPYYYYTAEIASGYRIQDVTMTNRTSLTTTTGLILPLVDISTDVENSADSAGLATPVEGFYPEEDFDWETFENPDGTTSLVIRVYPFYYNALTTDVRFYQRYAFHIDYTTTDVEITTLSTDRDVYRQGDVVRVAIGLENTGAPQDAIVRAVIKRYGSDEIVDGLLLHMLDDLEGAATFEPRWQSAFHPWGDYYVEATLEDSEGNTLRRAMARFTLGITSGRIERFSATPSRFDIGDAISISLVFSNTGTVPITGTAYVKVKDAGGALVQEYHHDILNLPPKQAAQVTETWNTAGIAEGGYRLLGYVTYEGEATAAWSAVVDTAAGELLMHLPVIIKVFGG